VSRDGGLGAATSEFVSTHMGLEWLYKANTRVYTGLDKNALRPVGSAAAHVVLHQSARSMGYKLSREGADPKSLRVRCVV
jgi:hypothetical protein